MRNHSPLCSCRPGYTGDAFSACYRIPRKTNHPVTLRNPMLTFVEILAPPPPQIEHEPYRNPCVPSPCGPNSECRDINGSPSCTCLPTYLGSPPNCRPECTINSECPSHQACINQKCADPCPGSCGFEAICNVLNHIPTCTCPAGYTGDPFRICSPAPPPPRKIYQ